MKMIIYAVSIFALYIASMVAIERAMRNETKRIERIDRNCARERAVDHLKETRRRIVEFVSRTILEATATSKTSVVLAHRFHVLFERDEPGGFEIDAPIGFETVASVIEDEFADYDVCVTSDTVEIVW